MANSRSKSRSKARGSPEKTGCVEQHTKKYTQRPSPAFPAAQCPGESRVGNDGKSYTSKENKAGVFSWRPSTSAIDKSTSKSGSKAKSKSKSGSKAKGESRAKATKGGSADYLTRLNKSHPVKHYVFTYTVWVYKVADEMEDFSSLKHVNLNRWSAAGKQVLKQYLLDHASVHDQMSGLKIEKLAVDPNHKTDAIVTMSYNSTAPFWPVFNYWVAGGAEGSLSINGTEYGVHVFRPTRVSTKTISPISA